MYGVPDRKRGLAGKERNAVRTRLQKRHMQAGPVPSVLKHECDQF